MDLYCTRPGCSKPVNPFLDLDDTATLKSVPQKYCTTCGMPLILDGRYLPLKLLGQGGFGAAFLARDRRMPAMRQCVVKLFQPVGNLSQTQLELAQRLFEREAEALEDLGNSHPLIPDLYAFFEVSVPGLQSARADRLFYLVQEFIDGETLEEELRHKGQLSAAEVIEMLEAILPVLTFVHDHDAIHRDIKPSNIMRRRDGLFYLLDFGAVQQAAKGGKSTGIYSEGFAPPEQVSGNQVFPATDLYALAVTSIVLLTGKQPSELFDCQSATWAWRSHLSVLTEPLATVLDRMLQPAPNRRFQSATETLAALRQPQSTMLAPGVPATTTGQVGAGSPTVLPLPPTPPLPTPPTVLPSLPLMPPPSAPARQLRSAIVPFSTLEWLGEAAFTGFESALLAIVCFSLPLGAGLSAALWLLLSAGLVLAQRQRLIERVALVLIAGGTLAIVVFFPQLSGSVQGLIQAWAIENSVLALVFIAGMAALGAIAITALFRLLARCFTR